jgi:hypothetical protein
MDALRESFVDVDFEAYLEIDSSEIETKIDEAQSKIEELDGKQIKIDMEWQTTNAIEAGMSKIRDFAKMIENDTKRVGESYLITAE